ncbi:MAG: reverse transcriptase domain-containing protein, partial [Candidatus Fonsibacter sp.]
MWDGLLGPYGAPAAGYTERYDGGPTQGVPAILFADQSKAFERISHAWMAEVLRRWGLPAWLLAGLMDQAMGRRVFSPAEGVVEERPLLCGIGMGGTASALLWTVCYDPVLVFIERAAGVVANAYVDDCAVLTRGPGQTLSAYILLLAAGHCAGLLSEGHYCTWLETRDAAPAAYRITATF